MPIAGGSLNRIDPSIQTTWRMRRGTFSAWPASRTLEQAQAALLPVGPDSRTPMRQVYQMFRGGMSPEDVMKAAGSGPEGQFYGHLYVGLYFDAIGRKDLAMPHITIAASDRYAATGGYMHMVATVHLVTVELVNE